MAVTSETINTIPVWQFSGVVTDAQVQTAWAGLVVNGVYVLNRAIYLDETADLTSMTGGFLVDFGTQVLPAILLNTGRDKTKSTFNNFTFLQRTGLSVANRQAFVQTWNGTTRANASGRDGVSQKGGGVVYGVVGNPGGGDPRFLNEMSFAGLEGVTIYSQEFTEQELQIIIGQTTTLKGLIFEKAYGFPQITTPEANVNVVVYRSTQNTQSTVGGGLIPIRLFPNTNRWAAVCYVDSYVTRNNADILTRLGDFFGSSATNRAVVMMLNNFTRESFFGASKTNFAPMGNWNAANEIFGGVLKKLRFVDGEGGVVRCYDSRSTTAPQKSRFQESGFVDFLDTDTSPVTDAEGQISLVHIGARATGAATTVVGPAITRFTGQQFTFQKFGFRVIVAPVSMISGDNDLSAFSPIILTEQIGIVRTESEINAATEITSFQDLLEELHVLAIGLSGSQSYNGFASGNLFTFEAGELKTNFTNVIVDASATSKIAYNFTTNMLIVKASIITDTEEVTKWNNSVGTITLVNGAKIQGVYSDSSGTSTVLNIIGFDSGSSVYVEDNLENQVFFDADANGTVTIYIPPTAVSPWYFAVEKYGNQRQSDFFTFNGGFRTIEVKAIPDVGISELDLSIVEAYTELDTLDKIYDYIAYVRLSPPAINYGQIAFRDGTILFLDDLSLLVDKDNTNVLDFAGANKLIIIKTLVLNEGSTYKLIKTTPPATITANTTEQINVVIEDANGDSQLNILGGDNLGYELWKVTTDTPTDDYESGELLATLPNNNDPFRFIGIIGFDIVGRDTSSGVRRRTSMAKGVYNQEFYVGAQIQLSTDAPQLIQNNQKLDELILKTDTRLDVKVSSRLAALDYLAPDNASIGQIKSKVDTLENTDISGLALEASVQEVKQKVNTLDNADLSALALETSVQDVKTAVDSINVDFTPVLDAVDQTLKASEYTAPDNATIGQIKSKVDTLENTDLTGIALESSVQEVKQKVNTLENADLSALALETSVQDVKTAVDSINVDFTPVLNAIDLTLKTEAYTAPDNEGIQEIKTKVDGLENTNLEDVSAKVWEDQPERLKNVATVQSTGDQISAL